MAQIFAVFWVWGMRVSKGWDFYCKRHIIMRIQSFKPNRVRDFALRSVEKHKEIPQKWCVSIIYSARYCAHCDIQLEFVVKEQDTLMTSLYQFTLLELVLDYNLPITVTWSSRVRAQFVLVSAAAAHLHHLCGMTFRLNWRTATLIDRVLNLALSQGFLSVPTRNRHLCELLFKRRYINLRFDWLKITE